MDNLDRFELYLEALAEHSIEAVNALLLLEEFRIMATVSGHCERRSVH